MTPTRPIRPRRPSRGSTEGSLLVVAAQASLTPVHAWLSRRSRSPPTTRRPPPRNTRHHPTTSPSFVSLSVTPCRSNATSPAQSAATPRRQVLAALKGVP
ncbi:hypothetical protein E2C01_005194 [Portunus trituberculatus]|uniref:Uncharacterized protein n=1 Tax=Portunus trituberculatus TaxID=210409 RepID=A0A5B7CTD1_PORTR|nr:hypothetical protein [Portunus trituberculatus]